MRFTARRKSWRLVWPHALDNGQARGEHRIPHLPAFCFGSEDKCTAAAAASFTSSVSSVNPSAASARSAESPRRARASNAAARSTEFLSVVAAANAVPERASGSITSVLMAVAFTISEYSSLYRILPYVLFAEFSGVTQKIESERGTDPA